MTKKKTATAAAAVTPAAPKSTKKVIPSLPCALRYFWQYAILAWGHCRLHREILASKRPLYTDKFIDEQIAYINMVRELPNNKTRHSFSAEVLLELKAARQSVADESQLLGKAINFTFKQAAVAKVQREAAGVDIFSKASASDWGSVTEFITTANNYLKLNLQKLVDAGSVNADFATNFESVGLAFNTIWESLVAKRQSAKDGTESVAEGIKKIKSELNPMLELGEITFKYDPELRKLFTVNYIVSEVRSGHTAGVGGRLNWAVTELPIADVQVEVLHLPDKSAVTDKKGRYEIKLAAGSYTLRFSSDDFPSIEKDVTVSAGVTRRLNMVVEPAPLEAANNVVETLVTPPLDTPPDSDELGPPPIEKK